MAIENESVEHHEVIVLGAGATGLAVARSLLQKKTKSVLILERNNYVGGLASSFQHKDFLIDFGPHKLFSNIPGIMDEIRSINGEDNLVVKKINSLYFLGKKFQFPIKPLELLQNISPKTVSAGLQIPLSLLKSIMLYNVFGKKAKTFEEYLVKGFGKKAYKVLFEGYANKVWDKPQNLSKDIAKIRIPVPNVGELIKNTLTGKSEPKVAAHEFYYPRLGMRQFTRKMATQIEEMEGTIKLNMPITSLTKEGDLFKVMTPEKTYTTTTLISTIPLSSLIHMYDQSTSDAKDRIDKLRYNDIHLVYLFFKKKRILRDNWVFFPEIDIAFNRVSEQKSFSPFMVPHDKTVICAEITNPSLIHLTNEELIERSIKDLIKTNTIKNRDALFDTHVIRLKNIYPIYDIHYKENLQHVLDFLEKHNILTIGRFGLFNYNNVDHCLDMGEVISNHVVENGDMSAWNTTRKKFDEYVIVD